MTDWLVDGEAGAMVAPDDRGLLYGDGVFETIAFHGGRSGLWPLHMARLSDGCRRLAIPEPDESTLASECQELVNGRDRAVIRLSITRGRGGRAYFPPESPRPTRILLRRDWPADLERRRREGLVVRTSPVRLAARSGDDLKHLNRLAQVMIAEDLSRHGADEALVLDDEDRIVEGLAGNVVVERDGVLIAPGPHPAAVAGVGIEWLRRRAGDALREAPLRASDLEPDDAIWVINSVSGPCGVARLDQRRLPAGSRLAEWQARWLEELEQ
ncbi:MAG: aminotransferase class IV [Candidatus Wenzhouxiangella sp. M2_3B_020]